MSMVIDEPEPHVMVDGFVVTIRTQDGTAVASHTVPVYLSFPGDTKFTADVLVARRRR